MADRNQSKLKTAAKAPVVETPSVVLERPYNDPFAYLAGVVRGEVKLSATDLSSLENNVIVVEILEAAKKSAKEGKTNNLK